MLKNSQLIEDYDEKLKRINTQKFNISFNNVNKNINTNSKSTYITEKNI